MSEKPALSKFYAESLSTEQNKIRAVVANSSLSIIGITYVYWLSLNDLPEAQ